MNPYAPPKTKQQDHDNRKDDLLILVYVVFLGLGWITGWIGAATAIIGGVLFPGWQMVERGIVLGIIGLACFAVAVYTELYMVHGWRKDDSRPD